MKVICAWCGITISKHPDEPDEKDSHGICLKCAMNMMKEMDDMAIKKETVDKPVENAGRLNMASTEELIVNPPFPHTPNPSKNSSSTKAEPQELGRKPLATLSRLRLPAHKKETSK